MVVFSVEEIRCCFSINLMSLVQSQCDQNISVVAR